MTICGITRYHIIGAINGSGANRFERSAMRHSQADLIYRNIFYRLGMPLLPTTEHIEISKEDFAAGYDRFLGIDVHLKTERQLAFTLQEKYLYEKNYHHVTVEYMQDHERDTPGDWFNLRCQLYFVGYDRYLTGEFDEWVLLNWVSFQMAIENGLQFDVRKNGKDGARASLACVPFRALPSSTFLAIKHYGGVMELSHDAARQLTMFPAAEINT